MILDFFKEYSLLIVALGGAAGVIRVWLKNVRPAWRRWLRLVREWEAAQQVIAVQLTKNSGQSLTDKVDAVYNAMFSKERASMPATLNALLETAQAATVQLDQRNKENITRLESIEQRVKHVESRQEYTARVFGLVIGVFPPELQEGMRKVIAENPLPEAPQ